MNEEATLAVNMSQFKGRKDVMLLAHMMWGGGVVLLSVVVVADFAS